MENIDIKRKLAEIGIHVIFKDGIPMFPYIEGESMKQTKERSKREIKEYLMINIRDRIELAKELDKIKKCSEWLLHTAFFLLGVAVSYFVYRLIY